MIIRKVKTCLMMLAFVTFCANMVTVGKAADPITAERATEIALAQTGGGQVVDMSRKYGGSGYYYWVQVMKGGEYYALEIDVNNGNLLKYINKSRDKSPLIIPETQIITPSVPATTVGLTHDQALAQALKLTNGGTVLESKLQGKKKGRLVYEFEIVNNGSRYEIEIDAVTGNTLDFERH